MLLLRQGRPAFGAGRTLLEGVPNAQVVLLVQTDRRNQQSVRALADRVREELSLRPVRHVRTGSAKE